MQGLLNYSQCVLDDGISLVAYNTEGVIIGVAIQCDFCSSPPANPDLPEILQARDAIEDGSFEEVIKDLDVKKGLISYGLFVSVTKEF